MRGYTLLPEAPSESVAQEIPVLLWFLAILLDEMFSSEFVLTVVLSDHVDLPALSMI